MLVADPVPLVPHRGRQDHRALGQPRRSRDSQTTRVGSAHTGLPTQYGAGKAPRDAVLTTLVVSIHGVRAPVSPTGRRCRRPPARPSMLPGPARPRSPVATTPPPARGRSPSAQPDSAAIRRGDASNTGRTPPQRLSGSRTVEGCRRMPGRGPSLPHQIATESTPGRLPPATTPYVPPQPPLPPCTGKDPRGVATTPRDRHASIPPSDATTFAAVSHEPRQVSASWLALTFISRFRNLSGSSR